MIALSAVKLRNQLRALDPTLTVELKNVRVNGALFGCSGFITGSNGAIVYVNTDHSHGLNENRPLYRTAKHTKDFTGGANRYATNDTLAYAVVALIGSIDNV